MELKESYAALVPESRLLSFEMCFQVMSRFRWAVSKNKYDIIDALQCEDIKNNQLTGKKMTHT